MLIFSRALPAFLFLLDRMVLWPPNDLVASWLLIDGYFYFFIDFFNFLIDNIFFWLYFALFIELERNHVPSLEDAQEMGFQTLPYFNIPNTTNICVFVLFTGVQEKSPEF